MDSVRDTLQHCYGDNADRLPARRAAGVHAEGGNGCTNYLWHPWSPPFPARRADGIQHRDRVPATGGALRGLGGIRAHHLRSDRSLYPAKRDAESLLAEVTK